MHFTDDQIKHMVDRFLSWTLPEKFYPGTPSGTNLFTAAQAEEMVRAMIQGMPDAPITDEFTRKRWETGGATKDYTPETALRVALDAVLSDEIDPEHLIVVYAAKDNKMEDTPGIGWYQGGSYNHPAQIGLLTSVQFCMNKTYL